MKPLTRRTLCKQTLAAGGMLAVTPWLSLADTAGSIRRVHLIFKTHLDIGFTDLAQNVVDKYFNHFIPAALSLAGNYRDKGTRDRFIWTTGSWLIYTFLEQASSVQRKQMEQAIAAGDIVWHGLPFTTHTELMDDSLFRLGMVYSARLDKRFGRRTISAKMTDVPGHTQAIIPRMADAGLQFLHIGVNPASMPPDVPGLFIWRCGDRDLVTMYQREYGSVMTLPGRQAAVAFIFTNDNMGPQSPQEISAVYDRMRQQFPGAEVGASTLDAVAEEILKQRDSLPAVTQELGDTWIHGTASDPKRVAQFRELLRIRRAWLADRTLKEHDPVDLAFGGKLIMIAEHTWGLDVKTFLKDWSIYKPADFAAARTKPNFQLIEKSWNEKRAYIDQAIGTLPENLAQQARGRIKALAPVEYNRDNYKIADPAAAVQTPHFSIRLDPATGAICSLRQNKNGWDWAGPQNPLALFAYQTFSKEDYTRFMVQYLTQKPEWALYDFGKPGMEIAEPVSRTLLPQLKQVMTQQDEKAFRFLLELEVSDSQNTGCPGQLLMEWLFPVSEPIVEVNLQWHRKPAYRLPEAIWFSFVPRFESQAVFKLDKMGCPISPLNVVKNGNRYMHGILSGVECTDKNGVLRLESPDAGIVSMGRRTLLAFDNQQPSCKDGLHFCLYNNVWGTNFTMWFEDDMRYRFALKFT